MVFGVAFYSYLKRASPRVAFRDLAPERVAVALDGRPVLADFGDAKPIESLSHTLCGTPEFVAVWKSSTGLGGPHQTSELSISIKSKSIRLTFGRIDCSRRVLEAQPKGLRRNCRIRAH